MKVHPAAELFPLMGDAELAELAEDIKRNGLQMSIIRTKDGLTVDGRNRELACEMAGVKPSYEDLESDDGDMVALVVSLNVKRRNLTASQRAMAAAEAWDMVEEGTKAESRAKKLAPLFGVNNSYISQARAVLQDDRLAAAEVKSGVIPLTRAYEELSKRRRDASSREVAVAKLREVHPDLAELVEADKLKPGEALAAAQQRERDEQEHRRVFMVNLAAAIAYTSDRTKPEHVEQAMFFYDPAAGNGIDVTPRAMRESASYLSALADAIEGGSSGKTAE